MSAPESSRLRRTLLLVVVLMGTMLGPLDSAVNIAFPDITKSFGVELQAIRWVVIAYVATYASLMLVFGRIGDLYGHSWIFGGGLATCAVAFAICGAAGDYNWLLTARMLQGVGTAMVLSCGPAMATNLFSEEVRPRILGLYAMIFGLGGAIGPSLGGVVVDLWGWPAVFWFRLPLALLALLLMFALHMPSPPRAAGRFDLPGSILLVAAIGLFLFTVSQLETVGDQPLRVVLLSTVTLVAIMAFVKLSKRSSTPILDFRSFLKPGFVWINIANVVVSMTGFATLLFVPFFLVRTGAFPLWQSGLIMAIGPVGMMLASNLGGWTMRALGANRMAILGAILVASGLYWISYWDNATNQFTLSAALFVHGAGLGLFQVASLEIVAITLPKSNRGVAGSLALVMRTIGVVMAASLLTMLFASLEHGADQPTGIGTFVSAFQTVFGLSAAMLASFIAISLFLPHTRSGPNH